MNLDPRFVLGSLDLTDYPYSIAFGSQIGAPENVTEVLNSLLADGELLSSERTSNREMTIMVIVEGPDLAAVAQAEAALVMEANRARNTLTIDPGDGYAVATVFDTFRAAITFDRSDAAEMANVRRYLLTIPALPYGRSEALITEVAEAIPSIGSTVNNCESLTGWSTPAATYTPAPGAMLAVDTAAYVEGAGSMKVQPYRYVEFSSSVERTYVNEATLTTSISVAAGGYVSFAIQFENSASGSVNDLWITTAEGGTTQYSDDGSDGAFGARSFSRFMREALANNWVRWTWREDSPVTITQIRWSGSQTEPTAVSPGYPVMRIDQIAVAATATLGNQVLKTLDIQGSARTTGALHIAAPSDAVALGKVLAFTVPQSRVNVGFRPDLNQWVLSGATTSTSGGRSNVYTVFGSSYGTSGSPVFQAPASMFRSGAYTLAASVRLGGTGIAELAMTIEASLLIGSTVVATDEVPVSVLVDSTLWEIRSLGSVYLPPAMIQSPSTAATVRFRIKAPTAFALEKFYAFPTEGDLTIIDCGSGTVGPAASSHCWIDSPSPDQPQGGYWRGLTPDRTDAIGVRSVAALTVPGTHSFEAEQMLAFVASLDAQGPSVSFDYYPRHFFHAAG